MSRIGVATATVLGFLSTVTAQNGFSFLDADESEVKYAAATIHPDRACQSLRTLTGYDYSILSARLIAASDGVPEHCRVTGVIPADIRFAVNLPSAWNGRFYMHGNGGYAGTPPEDPGPMRHGHSGLRNGFATAYTDTGHDRRFEPLGTFAYDNSSKLIDYAFRAVHLTAVTAKKIITTFYSRPISYSYWDGCSTGGRQRLMSAQRFPSDFDGIIAGAPVLDFTKTMVWNTWNAKALSETPISLAQTEILGRAVYQYCDARDGLQDGLINNPVHCDFDPRHLPQCDDSAAGDACFTPAEVATLKKIYGGVVSNGEVIFPGLPLGAEADGGWDRWIINETGPSLQLAFAETFFKYMAHPVDDPDYDWKSFDFDTDPARMELIRQTLDATDPDLSAFRERGGKIISYFGWADPALNPMMEVEYYRQVESKMVGGAEEFFRLFLVPGMFHCRGGRGTDQIDAMTALIEWVESDAAPHSIIASHVEEDKVTMSRPLCPYPQVATYRGSGSIHEASSFTCANP